MTKLMLICLLVSTLQPADVNPVTWKFRSTKIDSRKYEIRITAKIEEPWHIYSQDVNPNLAYPTVIFFFNNPMVVLNHKIKEDGVIIVKDYEGVAIKYYNDKVDFIQIVSLKGDVSTCINGRIEYQVCTDGHCLSPSIKRFSIQL